MAVLIILRVILQTVINLIMLSIGGQGNLKHRLLLTFSLSGNFGLKPNFSSANWFSKSSTQKSDVTN